MIITKNGATFVYKDVTYTIGAKVYANGDSICNGLYGVISEIRTEGDQIRSMDGPEILCKFIPPILPEEVLATKTRLSELYGDDLRVESLLADQISMDPEMLSIIDESKKNQSLNIFLIREDWAVDGEPGCSTAIVADPYLAGFTYRNMIFQEQIDGCIARWNDRQDFEETITADCYDCWLHDEYFENHYKVTMDRIGLHLPQNIMQSISTAYTSQIHLEDFLSQLAQYDNVSELPPEQYSLLTSDPSISHRIQAKLAADEAYWNCYWKSIAECTDELIREITPKAAVEKVKKYRVMVGAGGDDYVYADDLPWEKAVSIQGKLTPAPGAYAYIQEVSENG